MVEAGVSQPSNGPIPVADRLRRDRGAGAGASPIRRSLAASEGLELVRLGLVYPRRADLHAARLPGGQCCARIPTWRQGASFSGLWIHDAVGLFVTPLALAIGYAVIPAVTRRPFFSHFLSMIGFWVLFLVYPLNGTHHYVFSSIPMEAQKGAIVASVYLGADVVLVVTNLLLSMRGRSSVAAADTPLRFVWVGVIVYLIVSLQGSSQAIMPLNRFVHFSDWVIGHSHLAMIGFASFIALGGLLHAWRLTRGAATTELAAGWSFWLLTLGLAVMVLDLDCRRSCPGQLWSRTCHGWSRCGPRLLLVDPDRIGLCARGRFLAVAAAAPGRSVMTAAALATGRQMPVSQDYPRRRRGRGPSAQELRAHGRAARRPFLLLIHRPGTLA